MALVNKQKKRQALGFLALGLLALFMVMSAPTEKLAQPATSMAMDNLTVVGRVLQLPQKILTSTTEWLDQYFLRVDTYGKMKEKSKFYHLVEAERDSLAQENERLRSLLNMRERLDYPVHTITPVMDSRSPYAQSLLVAIDPEKMQVKKGQAVMSYRGLAGRVINVGDKSARVLLLNDRQAYIPIMLLKNSAQAMMRGSHDGAQVVIQTKRFNPKIGDKVITSGAAGVFPKGLPVGEVSAVTEDTASIELFTSAALLNELMILDHPTPGILLEELAHVQN